MVVEIGGVLNVPPVPIGKPPVGAAYQFIVAPALAVAPKVNEIGPGLQVDAGVVVNISGFTTVTVTGVEGENRYRHLDYCFSFSMYLVEKIRKNEKILLASPHTLLPSGKTIYEAFFTNFPEGGYDDSEFIAFCEEKLKDPNIPYVNNENSGTGKAGSFAYTYALDMFLTLCRQMINTGRIYTFNATHVNNHSSFLSPIEMTNLC